MKNYKALVGVEVTVIHDEDIYSGKIVSTLGTTLSVKLDDTEEVVDFTTNDIGDNLFFKIDKTFEERLAKL